MEKTKNLNCLTTDESQFTSTGNLFCSFCDKIDNQLTYPKLEDSEPDIHACIEIPSYPNCKIQESD